MVISSMKSATVGGSQQLYLRLHWNDRWVLPKVVSLTLLRDKVHYAYDGIPTWNSLGIHAQARHSGV